MRKFTAQEQAAFDAYVEAENQRIEPMPLKNVRRFFVDDTPPANFIQNYQWLKEMVLYSFLLLKPEHRPDSELLHDTLSAFDVFIDELKTDVESTKPETTKSKGFLTMEFMATINMVAANFMNGWITEKQASGEFIKAVKGSWHFKESGLVSIQANG